MPNYKSITVMGAALLFSACVDVTLGDKKADDSGSDDIQDTGGPEDTADPVDTGISSSAGHGWLQICFDQDQTWDSSVTPFEGEVISVNSANNQTACSQTVELELVNGNIVTMGYTVFDSEQADVSPEINLEVGQSVSGIYEMKCTWECDSALLVEDAAGLAILADQGLGMTSVSEAYSPFEVNASAQAYNQYNEDSCTDVYEHAIQISADSITEIQPLSSEEIVHQGQSLQAIAVAAEVYQDTPNCTTMDRSDHFNWLVMR